MTSIPVRIKVRCPSCGAAIPLSQEQYRELVKQSRLALVCPHCGHDFEYKSVAAGAAANPPPRPQPHRREAELDREPAPAPPPAAQASVPEFPPPPFAPLGGGTPANATPPPFAPLAGTAFSPTPAALSPQGAAAPTGGEAIKLTLNERWKRLPPWVQWTVIGVFVVVLAVIIFAMPTGGSGNGSSDSETPKAEHPRPKSEKKHSDTEKKHANDVKKAPEKAAEDNKDSQERQP